MANSRTNNSKIRYFYCVVAIGYDKDQKVTNQNIEYMETDDQKEALDRYYSILDSGLPVKPQVEWWTLQVEKQKETSMGEIKLDDVIAMTENIKPIPNWDTRNKQRLRRARLAYCFQSGYHAKDCVGCPIRDICRKDCIGQTTNKDLSMMADIIGYTYSPFDLAERAKALRAMDYLARCANDEAVVEGWLMTGVPDGEIDSETTDEDLAWLCEDKNFADIISSFLRAMVRARKSGGLYIDWLTAGEKEKEQQI